MLIETLLFSTFGLMLGLLVWWTWRQRELARQQTAMMETLAEVGKTAKGIAHDLDSLVGNLRMNLQLAHQLPPSDAQESLADAEKAAEGAAQLVQALRGRAGTKGGAPGSACRVLELAAGLLRCIGAPVETRIEGDLDYAGSEVDALRVIQNLLLNAVREAREIPGGQVLAELRSGSLRVTNPVRIGGQLDDRIYESGVSHSGSTGQGLGIALQAAARVGWTLRHEIGSGAVTFIVEPSATKH